jgi:hypothetical protein
LIFASGWNRIAIPIERWFPSCDFFIIYFSLDISTILSLTTLILLLRQHLKLHEAYNSPLVNFSRFDLVLGGKIVSTVKATLHAVVAAVVYFITSSSASYGIPLSTLIGGNMSRHSSSTGLLDGSGSYSS